MNVSRAMSKPECGWWLIKMIRGGPPTPACIKIVQTTHEPGIPENTMERSPFMAAFINGLPVNIDRVWMVRGQPITEQEYSYRCAVTDWAQEHAPETPEATPTKRIDLAQLAPIYRRRAV